MMRRFLPSVLEYSAGAEVVVADNGSTDESLQMLEHDFPRVHIIKMERNYGFAEGYNQALRQVQADVYVLLNSDVRVTPGWLDPLIGCLEKHPEVAALQPKIRCEWAPTQFEYAGAAGGFIDSLGYPYCRGRLMGMVETDNGQYDEPIPIFWATGAALVIRSADYWEAGGLDGRFFAHQEEIDLCWRLRSRGRGILCVPQSVVYHLGGGTLPQGSPRKTFLNFRKICSCSTRTCLSAASRRSCACASGSMLWPRCRCWPRANGAAQRLYGRRAGSSTASVRTSKPRAGRISPLRSSTPYPNREPSVCSGSIMSCGTARSTACLEHIAQCGASAVAAHCVGHHSALHCPMQRAAFYAGRFCRTRCASLHGAVCPACPFP